MYQITEFFNKVVSDLYQYVPNENVSPPPSYDRSGFILTSVITLLFALLITYLVVEDDFRSLLCGIEVMFGAIIILIECCASPLQNDTSGYLQTFNSLRVNNFY